MRKIEDYKYGLQPPQEIWGKPENPKLRPSYSELSLQPLSRISVCLQSTQNTFLYFKSFVAPQDPTELKILEKAIQNAKDQLLSLVSAVLDVFIEPFCQTFETLSAKGSKCTRLPQSRREVVLSVRRILISLKTQTAGPITLLEEVLSCSN